jgi:cytochrome P450
MALAKRNPLTLTRRAHTALAGRKKKSRTPLLDRLFAAPEDERWPLAREWIRNEPAPFFAELRAEKPILVTPDVTLVARWADVMEILSLPTVFTVDFYKPKMGDFMLAQDETPVNTRDKGVMHAMLSRDDLPRVRALVGELAGEALDRGEGRIEAVSQLSRLVPLRIVQQYFGLAGPDEDMLRWSFANQLDQFNNLPFDGRTDADAVHQAADDTRGELRALLTTLIPARLQEIKAGQDRDDVLCRVLRTSFPKSVGFGMDRMVINVGGLLIGAIETTSEAVVNALAELFRRPSVLAAAREAARADDPAAFDGFVWEALRFAPIVAFMFRKAVADHTLACGTPRATAIPAGAAVLPLSGSAMFDPDWVKDPDAFIPTRPSHAYLHFGWGHHACLGRYVAAVMVPEIVRQVLRRPECRPCGDIDFADTPFPNSYRLEYS